MFWEIQENLKQASVHLAPLQSTWTAPHSSCFLGSLWEPFTRRPLSRPSWPETKNGLSLPGLWVPLLENSEGTTQTFSPLPTQTWGALEEAGFPGPFSSLRNFEFDFAGSQSQVSACSRLLAALPPHQSSVSLCAQPLLAVVVFQKLPRARLLVSLSCAC